jgi:hypothetical protein
MIQVDEDGAWPRDSPFDLQVYFVKTENPQHYLDVRRIN